MRIENGELRMICRGGLWPSSDNSTHDKQNVGADIGRPLMQMVWNAEGGVPYKIIFAE